MIVAGVDVRRVAPWRPLAAAAVVAMLAAALVGPAQVVLQRCVPGDGAVGWLGLHLALLRTSVDCPDGGLAVGGSGAQGALVVATVALPTLLAHLIAAAGGASLWAVLARAAGGIRSVLAAVLCHLPAGPGVARVRGVGVIGRAVEGMPSRVLATWHPDRGPPIASVA